MTQPNGINYEVARSLHCSQPPRSILLDPASRASGIHINNYGNVFDEGQSTAIFTTSVFDESNPENLGIPGFQVGVPGFELLLSQAHGYGRTWLIEAIDNGLDPSKPAAIRQSTSPIPVSKLTLGQSLPTPTPSRPASFSTQVVTLMDPNDKLVSVERLQAGESVVYTIRFENTITATAPAQDVYIIDNLSPLLDWSSVRFIKAGFGSQIVSMATNGPAQQVERMAIVSDHRPDLGKQYDVRIQATLDPSAGQLRWTFNTLDQETGFPPEDAFSGFLPPNDTSGRGDGFVSFQVNVKLNVPNETIVPNKVSIIFDINEAIQTPSVIVTVGPPLSKNTLYLPSVQR